MTTDCTMPRCTEPVADGRLRGGLCGRHLAAMRAQSDDTPAGEVHTTDPKGTPEAGPVRYFVELQEDKKKPDGAFGGWPVDPGHPGVYSEEDVATSDWPYWAVAGTADGNLLVVDIDLYRIDDWRELVARLELESTYVVVTPSGGLHIYYWITDDSVTAENLRQQIEPSEHVDLKGPLARGIAVHTTFPDYDAITDEPPAEIEDVEAFTETSPVLEYEPEPEPSRSEPRANYEPSLSREEVTGIETTGDMSVIYGAVEHVEPDDIWLRSQQTEDGRDRQSWDPCFGDPSKSGTRLGWDSDIGWINRAKGGTDALAIVAAEKGIISDTDEYPEGEDYFAALDELRARGADIPEYQPGGLEVNLSENEIRRARRRDDDLEVSRLKKRFRWEAETAIEDGASGVIAGPTAIHKTGLAIETAHDRPVFLGTGRTRNYAEIEERAESQGLSVEQLPSFPRDCSLMADENPRQAWAKDLYSRDVKPREIIERVPDGYVADDDEYLRKLDTDWDEVDLLVGYPTHAFMPGVTDGRVVFLDDVDPYEAFADEFETGDIRRGVDELLDRIDSRYDDIDAVLRDGEYEILDQEIRRWLAPAPASDEAADLLDVRMDGGDPIDPVEIVDRTTYCSANILDRLRVLCDGYGEWPSEDFHAAGTWGGRFGDDWWLANLPDLEDARNVFVMSAYPAISEAEKFLERTGAGHEGVYGLDQYADWYDAKNVVAVRLSKHQRSGNFDPARAPERAERDAERHEAIAAELDPDFIATTKRAKARIDVEQPVENFGNLRGINAYREAESVYVGSTSHPGDGPIGRRAQFAGVEKPEVSRDGDGPSEWSSETAQRIHQREIERHPHEAATRPGRDDTDLTIAYMDTSCVPSWFETVDATNTIQRLSNGDRQVLDAFAEAAGPLRAREVSEQVDLSRRHVYNVLQKLVDFGFVEAAEATGAYNAAMFEGAKQPVKSGLIVYSKVKFHRFRAKPPADPWWAADDASTPTDTSPTTEQVTLKAGLDPPD